jgi:hypothetical protein
MAALTSPEKALLRATGHKAQLYLSILKPASVFTARVNMATPAKGARAITYDGDTGEASVVEGMTLWVGTSAGASNVGKCRVRSINTTTNVLTISENSLVWADDQYLTTKEEYTLWPIFPRFTDAGDFYKDYDIAYTDQNEQPPPIAIMGPPQCGFLTTGSLVFNLDGGQSYPIAGGESIAGYLWAAAAGVLGSSGSQSSTWTHTVARPDGTWLALTVTDTNTKTQITKRPFFVHERTGANAPISDFTLESLQGDWERGGWAARFTVYAGATQATFPDGAMVVVWHEATYGATAGQIGGYKYNNADARNVLFIGYVRGETVEQDWNTGAVSFEATTIDALLRRHMMFSVPLKIVYGVTMKWYMYTSPTVAQAVHHYWRWHSTLFQIADVFLPMSNTLKLREVNDFAQGNLYDQVDNFARQYGIFAHVCCDKVGRVHLEEDLQMLPDAARAAKTVVSDITKADRREGLIIVHKLEKSVGMVHLSGISYDGATATAIVSKAPGDAPEDVGAQVIQVERQVLSSQAQANTLAGRVLAAANNPYPEVRVKFAGHYLGALDLVPQEWWTSTLAAGDTPRGIEWTNKKLIARQVTGSYDPKAGSILADAIFEPEADAVDGETGDYPVTPPDDPDPPTPPTPPPEPPKPSGRLLAFDHTLGCLNYTTLKVWETRNTGATTIADNQGGYDPHWQTVQGSADVEDAILWRVQDGKIYRSTNCGRSWTAFTPAGPVPNPYGDSPAPTVADVDWIVRTDNVYQSGEHYFLGRFQGGTDWRGVIMKVTGNGTGEAWTALGTAEGTSGGAGWYYLFSEVSYTPGAEIDPPSTLTMTDRANILGSDTAAYATARGNCDANETPMEIVWSLGGLAAAVTKMRYYHNGPNSGTENFFVNLHDTWQTFFSTNGVDWTGVDMVSSWHWDDNDTIGWQATDMVTSPPPDTRYIKLVCTQTANAFHAECAMWLGALAVYASTGFTGDVTNVYPVWMDTDTADGQYLYITCWKSDGLLYLQKRLTADLTLVSEVSLGTALIAEVIANTWTAYPKVKEFTAGEVYVYGRMSSPAGLSGEQHLILSSDGGATFVSVEATWGTYWCGAFIVDADDTMTAIRNGGGAVPRFYRGVGALAYIVEIIGLTDPVYPDALTGMPGRIAVGHGTYVAESVDNGNVWSDLAYPTGGDVRSLVYV